MAGDPVRFSRSTPGGGFAQVTVRQRPSDRVALGKLHALLKAAVEAGVSFDADDYEDAHRRCRGAVFDLQEQASKLRAEADGVVEKAILLAMTVGETSP